MCFSQICLPPLCIFGQICITMALQIWSSGVSLKRSCKMQFRRVDLRSIGPPSQKLWPNLIFARFPNCNYNGGMRWGGPVLREGAGIFGINAFSDISFYWPKDQESSLGNMNFQNLIFVKWSVMHTFKKIKIPKSAFIKNSIFKTFRDPWPADLCSLVTMRE